MIRNDAATDVSLRYRKRPLCPKYLHRVRPQVKVNTAPRPTYPKIILRHFCVVAPLPTHRRLAQSDVTFAFSTKRQRCWVGPRKIIQGCENLWQALVQATGLETSASVLTEGSLVMRPPCRREARARTQRHKCLKCHRSSSERGREGDAKKCLIWMSRPRPAARRARHQLSHFTRDDDDFGIFQRDINQQEESLLG